jgi:lipopolysaccharide heptosyltransferase II
METQNVPHLLIFAPNWLGDAVMSLPAIADLRRALGRGAIDIAARPSIASLFTRVADVNDVVVLERRGGPGPDASSTLRDRKYGAAVLLTNSFRTALTAWRAGIPRRWGYRSDWRGPLLTRAVMPPVDQMHQAAYYQHLTRALGFASGPLEPRLEASPEDRRAGSRLLVAAGWDQRTPLVALAPGAAYGGAKRWPPESFAALASALARVGTGTVLVGGPGDARAGEDIEERAAHVSIPVMTLIGRTDLPALAGVLLQCRGLVTNDSGAMHFGAALGVRVTAMFGPTDEQATGPIGRGTGSEPVVLTHDVWCRPCLLRECPLTHRCMRGIGVDGVLAALQRP